MLAGREPGGHAWSWSRTSADLELTRRIGEDYRAAPCCGNLHFFSRTLPCDLCGQQAVRTGGRARSTWAVLCRRSSAVTAGCCTHAQVPSDEELTDYYQHQYRVEYHGQFTPAPHRVIREWNRGERLTRLLGALSPAHVTGLWRSVAAWAARSRTWSWRVFMPRASNRVTVFVVSQASSCGPAWNPASWPVCGSRRAVMWCCWYTCWSTCVRRRRHCRHMRAILTDRGRLYVEVAERRCAARGARTRCSTGTYLQLHALTHWRCWRRSAAFQVAQWLSAGGREEPEIVARLPLGDELAGDSGQLSAHTLHALSDFNRVTYYLRWRYLRQRLHTLGHSATLGSHPVSVSPAADSPHLPHGSRRVLAQCDDVAHAVQPSCS